MAEILLWVKSGLLFGIFSSVIMMLTPNKSYEKHISLVVGLLFVLVMIHPVMAFLDLDGQTYISYIQNFIAASEDGSELSEGERIMYGESIRMQLEAALYEAGYSVRRVSILVNEAGEVERVSLSFYSEVEHLEGLEIYMKNVFGEGVEIVYE